MNSRAFCASFLYIYGRTDAQEQDSASEGAGCLSGQGDGFVGLEELAVSYHLADEARNGAAVKMGLLFHRLGQFAAQDAAAMLVDYTLSDIKPLL